MDVVTIISSLGFPIAACVAMAMYISKRDTKHEQEVDKLRQSIDNNTKVMTELIFYLKGGEHCEQSIHGEIPSYTGVQTYS